MALWINDTPRDDWPDSLEARFGLDAVKAPRRLLEACPVDAETPLIQLNGLASRLGVRPRGCRLRAVLQAQLAHCAR